MPEHSFSLRELFDVAVDLPAAERCAVLDALCPDTERRERLDRMLALGAEQLNLRQRDADHLADAIGSVDEPSPWDNGQRIGSFELIEMLGEGGSSTVYRASRENDGVRQFVALKLLRRGLYSSDAKRQFRRERLALSQLQHPGIARLIEGGVTKEGLAYIALDLVDGQRITDYVRDRRLDLRQRLELFLQVCRAVEAAHQALIVHRDLKPGNVLVTHDGAVKLIDFGVAKLLDAVDDTQTQMPAFTPAYAAPEQHRGEAITTATDVYALGILLGELVTGQRLKSGVSRTPSTEVRQDAGAGVLPAAPDVTRRQVRGDLDNILMKAIAAEPARRYASAGAFADDVVRLLNGMPVRARAPTRWYRTSKFIQRHRAGVLVTSLLAVALIAALGIAVWQAEKARKEVQRTGAVRDFLVGLFDAARASLPRDQRPTPDVLVAQARKRIETATKLDPATRVDVLRTLGDVSLASANFAQAQALYSGALEAALISAPTDRTMSNPLRVAHADAALAAGRAEAAATEIRPLLDELRAAPSAVTVRALTILAASELASGHTDDAIAFGREAVAVANQVYPTGSADILATSFKLGSLLADASRPRDAIAVLTPAIEAWRNAHYANDERVVVALNNLAVAEDAAGDRPGSEARFAELLAVKRAIFDPPHDSIAHTLSDIGVLQMRAAKYAESEASLRESLSMFRQVLGDDAQEVASVYTKLGSLMLTQKKYPEADNFFRQAIELCARTKARTERCANASSNYAFSLYRQHRYDEAKRDEEIALAARRDLFGDDSPLVAQSLTSLSNIAVGQQRFDDAVTLSAEALRVIVRAGQPNSREGILARNSYAQALYLAGREDAALAEIDHAIADWHHIDPDGKTRLVMMMVLKAQIQGELKRVDDAHATIETAISIRASSTELPTSTIALLRSLSGEADLYPDVVVPAK